MIFVVLLWWANEFEFWEFVGLFPCVLPPDSCIGVAFILSDEVMTCDGGDNGVSAVEDAWGGDDEFEASTVKNKRELISIQSGHTAKNLNGKVHI